MTHLQLGSQMRQNAHQCVTHVIKPVASTLKALQRKIITQGLYRIAPSKQLITFIQQNQAAPIVSRLSGGWRGFWVYY